MSSKLSEADKVFLRDFGLQLRYLRENKNLTQEQFANECGMDRSYIGGVERGERNISLLNLKKIARALGVEVLEFFPDSPPGQGDRMFEHISDTEALEQVQEALHKNIKYQLTKIETLELQVKELETRARKIHKEVHKTIP